MLPRKEERGGSASVEDSVDVWIPELEDYIEKLKKKLITEARRITDNIKTTITIITRKINEKKNNCMDISRGKFTKFHTRRPGHS